MATASRKTDLAHHSPISINRAPVLSLWGAVVAERLGFDADEAATLGEAVSVLNARSKGRRLGIFAPGGQEQSRKAEAPPPPRQEEQLELLGRPVPIVRTAQGVRAVIGGEVLNPLRVRRKLEKEFGAAYPRVRAAMQHLARSFRPAELAAAAYGLYERFRPSVPSGTRGWGARGTLDPQFIRSLAKSAAPRAAPARKAHPAHFGSARAGKDTHPDRPAPHRGRRRTRTA
jgi:hypothetical protein